MTNRQTNEDHKHRTDDRQMNRHQTPHSAASIPLMTWRRHRNKLMFPPYHYGQTTSAAATRSLCVHLVLHTEQRVWTVRWNLAISSTSSLLHLQLFLHHHLLHCSTTLPSSRMCAPVCLCVCVTFNWWGLILCSIQHLFECLQTTEDVIKGFNCYTICWLCVQVHTIRTVHTHSASGLFIPPALRFYITTVFCMQIH